MRANIYFLNTWRKKNNNIVMKYNFSLKTTHTETDVTEICIKN